LAHLGLLSDRGVQSDRLQCRYFQKIVQLLFIVQQRFDRAAQFQVAATGLPQELVPLARVPLQRGAVQLIQLALAFAIRHTHLFAALA